MPVQTCQANNKPGFKFGPSGKCFTYSSNSETGRERARARAEAQGRAIEAEGGKMKNFWKSLFLWGKRDL